MRVNAIGIKHFRRDDMAYYWTGILIEFNREEWRTETQLKLEYYESEYQRLKESTLLLELAMWKARMDDSLDYGKAMGEGNKKLKIDLSDFRLQCRISCGADHVVENVWPYLQPSDYLRSQRQ